MLSECLFEPPAVWPNLSQHNVEIGNWIRGERGSTDSIS